MTGTIRSVDQLELDAHSMQEALNQSGDLPALVAACLDIWEFLEDIEASVREQARSLDGDAAWTPQHLAWAREQIREALSREHDPLLIRERTAVAMALVHVTLARLH